MARSKKDFTLREKKYAKTKIALTREFMNRMKTTRFSEISIKDVCEKVDVSEGTFYNYFPRKADVIKYYFVLTFLKIVWTIECRKDRMSYRGKIEHVFDAISDESQEPFLFYEIISVKTSEGLDHHKKLDLTDAEKVLGFPDCPGIEKIQATTMENYFAEILKSARKSGRLPAGFSVDDIVRSLMAMIIGVPFAIDIKDFKKLKQVYKTQLALLWSGLDIETRTS